MSHKDDDDESSEKQQQSGANTTTSSLLRILCLHDIHSNAIDLQESLNKLDERLYERHGIELVYINSPLIIMDENEERLLLVDTVDDDEDVSPPRRTWWETRTTTTDNKNDTNDPQQQQYFGLDASFMLIKQVWNTMPFCGILAVGQGAAISSILPVLLQEHRHGMPEFGVFVHGYPLLQEEERFMLDWNCLHVMDANNNDDSQRLVQQLGGEVHVSDHSSEQQKSSGLLTTRDFNAIGKFLVQEKKRLLLSCENNQNHNNDNNNNALVMMLQTQLHHVEQEAARVMAQEIAENPPKALMAIITPQAMGGWKGTKRHPEGGGAPCPSTFLLKRDKRRQQQEQQEPKMRNQNDDDDDEGNDKDIGRQHPNTAS